MTQSGNRAAWRSERLDCLEAVGVLLGTKRSPQSMCGDLGLHRRQIAAQYPDNGRDHG
jgi:hypothetical protein